MEDNIQFELVSPEARLVSQPATMVVIPGEEGQFGVMAGHSALVASLKAGVVELYADNDDKPAQRIFIAGGFADVTRDLCSVLAEEAVNVNDLDRGALEQQIANLKEDLLIAVEAADKRRIQKRLDLAALKLAAI